MNALREALEAAYDEAEKEVNATVDDEATTEETEGDAGDVTESEGSGDVSLESAAEQTEADTQGAESDEQQVVDTPPPESWSGAVKEHWGKLPPEVRAEIERREKDFHKGMTKLDEDRNFGLRMKEVVSPYMPIIQAEGGSPEGAFKDYLNMAYVMRQGTPHQKAQIVRQAMQQFGIDPQLVMQPQQQMNPEMMQLQNELMGLKQKLSEKEQLQEREQTDKILAEIQAFASDPANKYFAEVQDQMIALLESRQAKELKEAYETAIWANPAVRSRLLAEQESAQKAKRQKEIEAKKKAASSLGTTSGQNGQSGKNHHKSLRDELATGLDAVMGTSRL